MLLRYPLLALLLTSSGVAYAQLAVVPQPVDLSSVTAAIASADSKAQAAAEAAAASVKTVNGQTPTAGAVTIAIPDTSNLVTSATLTAMAATIPTPASVVPPVEVPGGAAGSTMTFRRGDAADNRISRTGVFSYNSSGQVLCSGSTTCTWAAALPAGAASYPVFVTALGASASPSIRCKVASSTNTGFTGMTCTQSSGSIVLGGLVEVTTGITPGTVYVLSLPATQANQ